MVVIDGATQLTFGRYKCSRLCSLKVALYSNFEIPIRTGYTLLPKVKGPKNGRNAFVISEMLETDEKKINPQN